MIASTDNAVAARQDRSFPSLRAGGRVSHHCSGQWLRLPRS